MWDRGRDVANLSGWRHDAHVATCVLVLTCVVGQATRGVDVQRDGQEAERGSHVGTAGEGGPLVFKLAAVDFDGAYPVTKDGTATPYEEPEWQDHNLDGKIQTSSANPDHRSPVCFKTNSRMYVSALFYHRNTDGVNIQVKATNSVSKEGRDLGWPQQVVSPASEWLCYAGDSSDPLGDEVQHIGTPTSSLMTVSWEYSTATAPPWNWKSAGPTKEGPTGQSANEVFVTRDSGSHNPNRQRTVLYHATRNGGASDGEVLEATWSSFASKKVCAWTKCADLTGTYSTELYYYNNGAPPQWAIDGKTFAQNSVINLLWDQGWHDGDCQTWSKFFKHCLRVNGLDVFERPWLVSPPEWRNNEKPDEGIHAFRVKTGTGQQNTPPQKRDFTKHRVCISVEPSGVITDIWDPSYGYRQEVSSGEVLNGYSDAVVKCWLNGKLDEDGNVVPGTGTMVYDANHLDHVLCIK